VRGAKNRSSEYQGVGGLKALGVRDLTYKMSFLACSVHTAHGTVSARAGSTREGLAANGPPIRSLGRPRNPTTLLRARTRACCRSSRARSASVSSR
jgi:hypothetical protein